MLPNLDEVPWGSLEHAYGPATDIPELLRSIARGESDADPLFGNLWHQGTVYTATAPAVPFLVELAEHAPPALLAQLLHLLACMSRGVGYYQVHGALPYSPPEGEVAVLVRDERTVVTEVHAAVCAALPRLSPHLRHPEVAVRQAAVDAIASLAGVGASALEHLRNGNRDEPDPVTRAVYLRGLSELALRGASTERWRLDPDAWTAPLASAPQALASLHAWVQAAEADGATPVERVIGADVLRTLGLPLTRALDALLVDLVAAESSMAEHLFDELFAADRGLRVAAVGARCGAAKVPPRMFVELQDLLEDRSSRAQAVALLVALVRHPDADARLEAASRLRHVGLAAAAHRAELVAAATADPALVPFLIRPLRVLGDPAAQGMIDTVLRGDDDRAILNVLEHVGAGDPAAWSGLLEARLQALDPRAPLRGGASNLRYAQRSRFSSVGTSDSGTNFANRLRGALDRIAGATPAPRPLGDAGKADGPPGWPAVDGLRARWAATRDPATVEEAVVRQLVPMPSGRAALALLEEIGAARLPTARPKLEALLAEASPLSSSSVEGDEDWLAALRRVLAT